MSWAQHVRAKQERLFAPPWPYAYMRIREILHIFMCMNSDLYVEF